MPFVKEWSQDRNEGFVLFEASRRSKAEQDALVRLAERDEMIAAALEWEGVFDQVQVD